MFGFLRRRLLLLRGIDGRVSRLPIFFENETRTFHSESAWSLPLVGSRGQSLLSRSEDLAHSGRCAAQAESWSLSQSIAPQIASTKRRQAGSSTINGGSIRTVNQSCAHICVRICLRARRSTTNAPAVSCSAR